MKIGFDAKRAFHNNTGLGNYSRDLIKILASYFPENEYVLYNTKPKKIDRLGNVSGLTEVMPKTWLWKKLSSVWRQGPIVNQILEDKIDIYHGLSGEIPRNTKKKGIKTIVTIHDLIFVRYPELYSFIDRKIYFNKFKYAAENADCIIAISEQTKEDIVTFLKVDPSKIKVVYQGCHTIFKEPALKETIANLKEKYSLPEKFILNVGTLEKRKNILGVIKAIKDIDTHLVMVGRKTSYYTNEVESYIKANKLEDRIHHLHGIELKELAALYQLADIFVYPSIFEGFGIPIIEALYSKTPVITSRDGVFPEAGGPFSVYVNPLDVKAIKEAIEQLLKSEEKRVAITTKSHEFVQKFNDEMIAKKLMEVYTSVYHN